MGTDAVIDLPPLPSMREKPLNYSLLGLTYRPSQSSSSSPSSSSSHQSTSSSPNFCKSSPCKVVRRI